MGAAILTNGGITGFLDEAFAGPLFVRLYRNNVPVAIESQLSDFEQALFPGYADLPLAGLWSAAVIDPTGRAVIRIPVLSWTRGSGGVPETEYGWVLYEFPVPDSVLRAGQQFDAPITTDAAGQMIVISLAAFLLRG